MFSFSVLPLHLMYRHLLQTFITLNGCPSKVLEIHVMSWVKETSSAAMLYCFAVQ